MTTRLPAFGVGVLTGLLLALLVTGGADARPATRDAIPAAPMGVVEPDRREWRTWTAPPSVPPAPDVPPAPEATPTPRPQPDVRPTAERKATPKPASAWGRARHGIASYMDASYGSGYLAARLPKGTRVRVCGPVGCIRGTVMDWGPNKRIHPDRIVDLSLARFRLVCGSPRMGLCGVTVERMR